MKTEPPAILGFFLHKVCEINLHVRGHTLYDCPLWEIKKQVRNKTTAATWFESMCFCSTEEEARFIFNLLESNHKKIQSNIWLNSRAESRCGGAKDSRMSSVMTKIVKHTNVAQYLRLRAKGCWVGEGKICMTSPKRVSQKSG